MGQSAEVLERSIGANTEQYAHSLGTIRIVGNLAVGQALETSEGIGARETLKKDWDSALIEMVKISEGFTEHLEINRVSPFDIVDGQVVTGTGQPMVEAIDSGIDAATRAAEEDPRMWTQVRRDESDRYDATRNDEMAAGKTSFNTRLVLSIDPKEAIERDGADFWQSPGKGFYYTPGMAFLRLYHVPPTEKPDAAPESMMAGAYSVDLSDKEIWREVMAEFGVHIPEDEITDTWLCHALETQLDTGDALALPGKVRARYYEKYGDKKRRHSVDEFMALHQDYLDQNFDELYIPFTMAAASGRKNAVVHDFVGGLMQQPAIFGKLKPEIQRQLVGIYNRDSFDDQSARLVDSLIRYGVVEGLHEEVKGLVAGKKQTPKPITVAPTGSAVGQIIAQNVAGNVMTGAEAGRSSGACGESIKLTEDSVKDSLNMLDDSSRNAQDAYGGRKSGNEDKKTWKLSKGPCKTKACPNRSKEVKLGPCGYCMSRCQMKFDFGKDPTYTVAA